MNTQPKLITAKKFFEIIAKDHLTPIEEVQIERYEKYIEFCKEYEEFISPAAQSILNEYNSAVRDLLNKENRTAREEQVLQNFLSDLKNNDTEKTIEQQMGLTRDLTKKAGYIDATIILTILLNIGFIVAMTLIGR